tara:strand:+ start:2805 stop:4694 length:1890 start_codon:yes stop_codon:yes gene_type:complete
MGIFIMSFAKHLFVLCIYLHTSVAISKELPYIYISPNPSKENIILHAGNVEYINISDGSRNSSLSNTLKNKTSMSFSRSGGIASQNQLRMRGGEANHVLVLIDGIEVNDPASGSEYDFSHFYNFNLDKIEILKGAYSNVHGTDAMSGVINIKTKNKNGVNITSGSNNTNIKNYSFTRSSNFFQYGMDINLLDSSGIDTSGSSGDRNRYENENIRLSINSINHNFTLFYFDIYRQSDRDSSGNVSDNENAVTDINQLYSKYTYTKIFSKNISSENGLQYSTTKNLDFSPSNGVWETLTQSEKLKITSNTSINLGNLFNLSEDPLLSIGIEYEKINFTQLVLNTAYGNGNQMQSEYSSSFSLELLHPIDNFQFEVSARRTINQRFANKNTHRFGISYKLKNGKFFINHSTAFKNPTFTERFGYYAETFNGNPNLNPENIRQYEAGYLVNIYNNNINISQTFYNMKLKNEINGFVNDGNGGYTAKNIANRSHRRGVESKINYKINKNSYLTLTHDYTESTQHNSTKNIQEQEIRRPKNLINLNYQKSISNKLSINSNILYSSKIKDTDFSTYPSETKYLSDYYLFNSVINYKIDTDNEFSLFLNNIFNRKYNEVYGYNMPGFEVLLNYNRNF